MRKIAIIGGGQSGLQLALGLQKHGYEVTVVTDRTPEQVRKGRVMSSQFMFHDALQNERDLGINFWEKECPITEGMAFSIPGPDGKRALFWESRLDHYGQAVDQRVKFAGWMEEFARRGGNLVIHEAKIEDLERYARSNELVLVATGKGQISKFFERDATRSPFDTPMRALALTYVKNMVPWKPFSAVAFSLIPGVGEYFVFPALTTTGPCEIMVFEGHPGGPMDRWGEVKSPDQHLQHSKDILKTFVPWEAERCEDIELTDEMGILMGRFAPTVRKPVGTLPSGAVVMGMADAVVLNDPITGQGSNTASKCVKVYLDSIMERGKKPFDVQWMQQTFNTFWDYGRWVVRWTNSLLTHPEPQVLELMGAAQQIPALAHKIANDFNNPPNYNPWWFDADEAQKLIASFKAKAKTA
ncbi:MAG: NAD(P)-binding domain-containing protein [Acidobacteria bacterium]|nr:NAD(P)-binding domain-containing protein [Acidobacteriota bacterium]